VQILQNIRRRRKMSTNTSTSKNGTSFAVHDYGALETYNDVSTEYRSQKV
jgi:hypothetical protein